MRVAAELQQQPTPSRYATPSPRGPRPRGRGKPESPCPWPRPSSAHRTRRQGRLRRRCASAPRPYDPGRRLARSGSYPGHEARPARPRTLTETTTNQVKPGHGPGAEPAKLDRPLHMRSGRASRTFAPPWFPAHGRAFAAPYAHRALSSRSITRTISRARAMMSAVKDLVTLASQPAIRRLPEGSVIPSAGVDGRG